MRRWLLLLFLLDVLVVQNTQAGDVTRLAECTVQVFDQLAKSGKWSGKAPAGCRGPVSIEQRRAGLFVTAWSADPVPGGWVRTAYSAAMAREELASRKDLPRAGRDIRSRAGRLERCLESVLSVNDPLECRDRTVKSYQTGEATGIETTRLIWLDDNGRHCVVEYAYGNTSATPSPPVDLFNGEPLLPGMIINLRRR